MSSVDPIFAPAALLDPYLEQFIRAEGLPGHLTDAILYSLLAPGKRLRPVLVWHACSMFDGDPARVALPAMSAVELIHTFSLVHDDLPALDDDDLRRGRPTLHKHAGEAMAILAGDAMLTLAFNVIASRGRGVPQQLLTKELAVATSSMIAGQVYDTLGGLDPGLPAHSRLEAVHRNKTGALIRASCRMGVLCASANGTEAAGALGIIDAYAEAIGLMFQIVDDLLDVEQSAEHTGKRTGKDAGAGKLTYPAVLGVGESRAEVERLRAAARDSLDSLGANADNLRALADFLASRTK
ncbi:geranylgeranyl diphosphate synthase, type II [Phycisphaerales bacterium]|nr:geranylgeranyl diphosphate synthase, type II [Phycisphaerales bacterium]